MEPSVLLGPAIALLVYGAISRRASRGGLTPPMWFLLVGWVLGSGGLGLITLPVDSAAVSTLAELALVLVLFTDAARIDLSCLRHEESLPLRLLSVGLPLTVVCGAGAAAIIFPEFILLEAVLLGAVLAPTDAALGQAVVSDTRVPVRIRQTLNIESGLNDGLVLPLVLITASLAGAVESGGDFGYWTRFVLLQLVLGPSIGVAWGYGGGRLVDWASRRAWMTDPFERLSVLGIAVCAFASAELVGGNGFIAAFAAGLTLGNTARGTCSHLYEFGEAEGQLLTLLVFLILGNVMIPEATPLWSLPVVIYALMSLTVVRMVPVALALIGAKLQFATVALLGWFGPRGLASILFMLLIVDDEQLAAGRQLEAVVILTVLLSTMLHGISASPLASRYAAGLARTTDGLDMPEHMDAPELPVRHRG